MIVSTSLSHDTDINCQRVLGEGGQLSVALPDFVAREQQIQLASAISDTIRESGILVAEAGTGTGKTYAYLIPCLLSGKKALISTATKTLQDQLFQKDLPLLLQALGLPLRVQNLKGRANYLCRYRIQLHAEEGHFSSLQCAHEISHVRDKLAQFTHGERSELPEVAENSALWPYVTSTTDNCLGLACEYHQTCFLVNARKRAMEADVVVINHHLFFADLHLKDGGFGELLPGVHTVVFDEAHQLAEIAANFQGSRLGTRQIRELMDDVLREWPILDLANQPLKQLSLNVDHIIDELLASHAKAHGRIGWRQAMFQSGFALAWASLLALTIEIMDCFATIEVEDNPGLDRVHARLHDMQQLLLLFNTEKPGQIRWLEYFKQSLVLHSTPVDIAASFYDILVRQPCAYIFTSATLTMSGSFESFTRPLGLNDAKKLTLPSPFDFKQHSLLYLPRGLPDPRDARYYEALLVRALPVIDACGGRCFFLFTSHWALQSVAKLLGKKFKYPLLIQGDEAKPILLARFRELGNAVLLGTSTFWEGVDVKGQALSCVIIDKLPFASPADPVVRGRMDYLKSRGLSGFDELSLPDAVLALKQGVGRLIRDASDRGVLMIADPRLTGRDYGRNILSSLPAMRKTRDEQVVLTFIKDVVLSDEITCN